MRAGVWHRWRVNVTVSDLGRYLQVPELLRDIKPEV
jgi:hypothetical protein